MKKIFYLLSISFLLLQACSTGGNNNSNISDSNLITVSDVDGNSYNVVNICNHDWIKLNLNVSKYNDGTVIPQVTDPTQWANLTTGAWCYYNNDPIYGLVYGKLYNWYAVAGIYDAASLQNPALRKKLAPTGWHIPSYNEWNSLIDCLGGTNVAGGKMKEAGTLHWNSPNTGADNSSFFTGLPGGYRYGGGTNNFTYIGSNGDFWTSTESTSTNSFNCVLYYGYLTAHVYDYEKTYGFSVRCIKD